MLYTDGGKFVESNYSRQKDGEDYCGSRFEDDWRTTRRMLLIRGSARTEILATSYIFTSHSSMRHEIPIARSVYGVHRGDTSVTPLSIQCLGVG